MFSFIWDEKYGLKSFIQEADLTTSAGWLNLLSLDGLFPYFEMNIKERRLDLYFLYQQAKSKLLPEQVDDGLEGRLLRSLVLLGVTSGDPHLRTNRELLQQALALPAARSSQLLAALGRLEQAGIVYLSQAGYYQLVQQGQANPRELRSIIERHAQEVITSPMALLNEQYKPTNVTATNYNKVRGTDRKLLTSFVSVNDLAISTSLEEQFQKTDGLLWYVVAHTEDEQLQARSAAIQLTKQHNQLVVTVPRTPSDLIERFKCKISLERLRSTPEYKRSDYQELLADTGVVGRDYQSSFQRERQRFSSSANLEWYFNGQITIVQDQHQLWELATRVMQTVFPATPAHKTAQHLAKGSGSASKQREALDHILSAPFQRSGKKSPSDIILFDGAEELGLISLVGQEGGYSRYDVCVPDPNLHQQSRVIWDMFDEQLKARDVAVAWLEISEELARPPFGLSPQVIELFLAAFLRFNKDCIKVYTTKKGLSPQIDVTEDIIIKMIESPKDYIIQYKSATNKQEHLLHARESIGNARHAADSQAQRTSFATSEETRNKPIVPSSSMVSVESKPSLASTPAISSPSQAQQPVTDVTTEGASTTRAIHRQTGAIPRIDQESEQIPTNVTTAGAPTTRAIHRQTGTIPHTDQESEQIPTDSAISASSQPKDSAETCFATSSSYQLAIPPLAQHPTDKHSSEDRSHLYKTYTIEDTEEEDWDKAPVEQAFNIVRAIFDGLAPKDQRKLCIRVVEEYNSR